MKNIRVTKRNKKLEPLDISKIHKIVTWATTGISNVSVSDIEMNAQISFFDKISTDEIHTLLVKSAADLIDEENVNYDKVAARLLLYQLRKNVWGESEPSRLYDFLIRNKDIYNSDILEKYSESEIHKINKFIKHNRDDNFTYAGLQQMIDKYLVKDRKTGKVYETPQFAYIIAAMTDFINYGDNRLQMIKEFYDGVSLFKINLPTPVLSGLRTKIKQYASCILLDVDDTLDSIFANNTAIGQYTAKRAGIGINAGRIRPIGSKIRNGEVIHTGVIPFLKVFESTTKSTSQNGIRGGGGTVNVPFWHQEIEDILVLKNNAGTDDNRVRKLDYTIQFSKLFYQRLINNEDITLFSTSECPGLYDSFGQPEFDELYKKYEASNKVSKKTISARKLAELFSKERLETGRYYIMNIDHANSHSSWNIPIKMSNLCIEITQPTIPLKSYEDPDAEVGVCILSAINMLEVKLEEIPNVANTIVRFLDEIIDLQEYPLPAAANFAKKKRSLGVGLNNLAGFLAKNKTSYSSKDAIKLVDEYTEAVQYYLLKASCELAKEKGKCDHFDLTSYSKGILPIDTYCKKVDDLTSGELRLDWESLRKDIAQYGLRHSSLTAQMPCESSSVPLNSTNGIEPVRALISYKKSKAGILKQIVPNYSKYKDYYEKAFTLSNRDITNISAVIQKYFDMAISTNHYYNYAYYPEGNIPLSELVRDMIYAYQMGLKSIYYTNTPDGDGEAETGCVGGACSI